jgi:hypothetical protein
MRLTCHLPHQHEMVENMIARWIPVVVPVTYAIWLFFELLLTNWRSLILSVLRSHAAALCLSFEELSEEVGPAGGMMLEVTVAEVVVEFGSEETGIVQYK